MMKLVKSVFRVTRKHFGDKGIFRRLRPLFDATESFFFLPSDQVKQAPVIRDNLDLKRLMSFVILALGPLTLFGIFNAGYQVLSIAGLSTDIIPVMWQGIKIVLPLILVSYIVGFSWEILFASVRGHSISEGFLVTGLLFPLTLPPSTPLWMAAVGISFGVVIGKEIFGGTGRNILNPALTGRAFLFFAYPASMSGQSVWVAFNSIKDQVVDIVTGATPLALVTTAEPVETVNNLLLSADYSFLSMLIGLYPGSIGGTSALLAFVGAILLIITGVANYRIIVGGIMGLIITAVSVYLFGNSTINPWVLINPMYHLVMGGFAFGIVFMATDPVSAPGMNWSRWVYGFMIGFLTIVIRVFNPAYPEGVMLAILFMNLFTPLLDHIEVRMMIKKRIPNIG